MNTIPDAPVRPSHSKYRWAIVLALAGVSFALSVDRVNIMVIAPYLAEEFGLSSRQLGSVLSAFLFGYATGLIPGGWLADRFGAHVTLTFAGVSWTVLTVLMGLLPKTHMGHVEGTLVGLRFVLGLCEACAYPAFARALANWMCSNERAVASGLIHAGQNIGGIVAPLLVYLVIKIAGWRESFLCSGAVTLIMTAWWWFRATDSPAANPKVSAQELALIAAQKEELRIARADREWYRCLFHSRNAYMLCVSEAFYGLSSFVFLTWFYIYFVKVRGVSGLHSAFLTSLTYAGGASGALIGGYLCDWSFKKWGRRWGRRMVPLLAISSAGLFCVIAPVVRDNTVAAGLFSLAAGLQFMAAPAFWATVIDVTRRGPGILGGFMNASGNLGAAIGTILFPWLISLVGWQAAFQLTGLAGLMGGLAWLGIDSARQIDAAPLGGAVTARPEFPGAP